ncbi:PKD domain-containing protein [Nocardioides sp. zg-536]|uniref:PKD domain-containing protein n=1 Tax=Nocardioides faecalis TaxID=2803858 RepID=A0A939BXL1_9ACTN|nr:PKD domain-containing protein [Nocardioides faecalis]MBM9458950.1 PKD domain-containing protein [Nocardioides faecalis]QVI60346.1 PKD domain-containing protein [Nocardioides faecalis]
MVSAAPASFTPHVMDGEVLTMTRVGDLILVGGRFTRVRQAGSSTDIPRRNLFAFHVRTGQVSATFAPNPNGTVQKVQASPDGATAYVGGAFTSVTSGGVATAVGRLYRVAVATGNRVAAFSPGTFNGDVRDIAVTGDRLWVAGKFTHVQGTAQRALVTVNATTGVRDPYFSGTFTGSHQPDTGTYVLQIAINPANSRLVVVGNFAQVNGADRHQFAVFDIGGPTYALAGYSTRQFESRCSAKFYSYVTDVEYSPDGRFFAVSTTGAYGGAAATMAGTSGCDVVARFESSASGTDVRPTWTAYTGGDTTWSVEVTQDVVYVGGHARWQNNPTRGDAAGQGAVSRPGIAALSAVNGLPLSWNPTRSLGEGVKDMIATPDGLFVGSDTEVFADQTRRRIAFLPLAGGTRLVPLRANGLPTTVYRVPRGQSQLQRRAFTGSSAGAAQDVPNALALSVSTSQRTAIGTGWGSAVGAFMLDGVLYTAYSDGSLTRRTFDGQSYGPAVTVQTADRIVYQDDWHRGDVPAITSLFYDQGWMYFTKSGSNQLFRRAFERDSDVVGQHLFTTRAVSGVRFSSMRGAFVAGGRLYYATSSGTLNVATWSGWGPSAGPVAGTSTVISGAGGGWTSRVMFPFQGTAAVPANRAPTASFTAQCAQLSCTMDARASSDPDGTVTRYAWKVARRTSVAGTSSTLSHVYPRGGERTVTLTVTDDRGASSSTTRVVQPAAARPGSLVASATGDLLAHNLTLPAPVRAGDLLVKWFVASSITPTSTA